MSDTHNAEYGWLRRQAEKSERLLRSLPRDLLGPAGRRLLDALDKQQARADQ